MTDRNLRARVSTGDMIEHMGYRIIPDEQSDGGWVAIVKRVDGKTSHVTAKTGKSGKRRSGPPRRSML